MNPVHVFLVGSFHEHEVEVPDEDTKSIMDMDAAQSYGNKVTLHTHTL